MSLTALRFIRASGYRSSAILTNPCSLGGTLALIGLFPNASSPNSPRPGYPGVQRGPASSLSRWIASGVFKGKADSGAIMTLFTWYGEFGVERSYVDVMRMVPFGFWNGFAWAER